MSRGYRGPRDPEVAKALAQQGAAALKEWRADTYSLEKAEPTLEDLLGITLKQVQSALLRSGTPQPIRQKYHLAILRLAKAPTSSEKTRALAQLVALSKGKDGGESHAVAENAQDPDEE